MFFDIESIIYTLIGAALGGLISYYFASRGQVSYQYKTINIISSDILFPSNLKVTYKNKEINKLRRTYLVFWNSGNKEIRKNDIAEFSIKFQSGQVYHSSIINANELTNKFIVDYTSDLVTCGFDYMNAKHGVLLEILHDSDCIKPDIQAIFKGFKVKNMGLLGSDDIRNITNIAGIIIIIMMILNFISNYIKNPNFTDYELLFKIISSAILVFIVSYVLSSQGRRKCPKELCNKITNL